MDTPNSETAKADERATSSVDEDSVLLEIRRIVAEVVAPAANDVDRHGRFPHESISALKSARLLAAPVPRAYGGLGCPVPLLAKLCTVLAQGCASTAMIAAMHYGQVYILAGHAGSSPYLRRFLQSAASEQLLVASATSEVGVRDIGTSNAFLVRTGDRFQLEKRCSVLSYAEHTDAILATARRAADCKAADQSFVLLCRGDYALSDIGAWDALGMRGTCSPPVTLRGRGLSEQILSATYREIAERSMIPISNILWSAVWLGIAKAAFATARSRVQMSDFGSAQAEAPGSRRLTRAARALQSMRNNIHRTACECEVLNASLQPRAESELLDQILRTNNLKISTSEQVWQICHECLVICGVAGYLNQGRYTVGRHLRDSLSAALMLGNDRIEATNAALLLLDDAED